MVNILALDTSTEVTYLSLSLDDGREKNLILSDGNHDTALAGMFRAVFQDLNVEFSVVDKIIIGSGPGSFTGLRIGFSFIEGFAQALGLSPESVSSLAGYAEEYRGEAEVILTLADARRKEVFFSSYRGGDVLQELVAPTIYSSESLNEYLASLEMSGVERDKILIVYTGEIELPEGYRMAKPTNLASYLIKLAVKESYVRDVCEPFYLRKVAAKTIAERELDRKNKL